MYYNEVVMGYKLASNQQVEERNRKKQEKTHKKQIMNKY